MNTTITADDLNAVRQFFGCEYAGVEPDGACWIATPMRCHYLSETQRQQFAAWRIAQAPDGPAWSKRALQEAAAFTRAVVASARQGHTPAPEDLPAIGEESAQLLYHTVARAHVHAARIA
jgi:hypothetical protein